MRPTGQGVPFTHPTASRILVLIVAVVGVMVIGFFVWRVRSIFQHPNFVQVEGQIIGRLAPATAIPGWLREIVGGHVVLAENYPPSRDFQTTDRCAGRGCGYLRPWRALTEIKLFRDRSSRESQPIYTISQLETVYAESGIWIDKKPGVLQVTEPVSIGGIDLRPGDFVYSLMDLGDGFVRGFFHGYLAEFRTGGPNNKTVMRKLSDYEAVLWVRMKTGTGILGWTNQAGYPAFDRQNSDGTTIPYVLVVGSHEKQGLWDYELEVYPNRNRGSIIRIDDTTIRCTGGDVQKLHTGFVVSGGRTVAIELYTDPQPELLARTFVNPETTTRNTADLKTARTQAPEMEQAQTDDKASFQVPKSSAISARQATEEDTGAQGTTSARANHGFSIAADKTSEGTTITEKGYLTVRVSPPGAIIDVAGLTQLSGELLEYPCPPGTYTITVSARGMKTETRTLTVQAGEHVPLTFNLSAEPGSTRTEDMPPASIATHTPTTVERSSNPPFSLQLVGSSQLYSVAVSLMSRSDATGLFIYWSHSGGNQVVKLSEISKVELKHRTLELYAPGTLIQFGIGGPQKPRIYELVVEVRDARKKKFAYHFLSNTAVCRAGSPCQEGTDGAQSLRDFESALQAARNALPSTQ